MSENSAQVAPNHLEIAPTEPIAPPVALRHVVTTLDPLRVLIVEDSSIVSERLVAMINGLRLPIRMSSAENGEKAAQIFLKQKPDAVVLDIALPDLSGFDLLAQFKTQQPACTVIMLTTYAYPEFRANAARLGANFFFSKVMEFERVSEVLAALVVAPTPSGGVGSS